MTTEPIAVRQVRAGAPAAPHYPSGFSACGVRLFKDGIDPATAPREEPTTTTRAIAVPWRRLALVAAVVGLVLLGCALPRFIFRPF